MTVLLSLAVFFASCGALVLEIAAARLLAPYVGGTVQVWVGVIVAVLLGLSAGAFLGGRLAEGQSARIWLSRAFALAAAATLGALGLAYAVGPVAGRGDIAWLAALAALAVPFAVPALFAGIVKPIATKLAIERAPERAGRVIGMMYAAGAAGAVAGTLATGFVLLSILSLSETILAVAAAFASLSIVLTTALSAHAQARRPPNTETTQP
ncbi:MAG: fused MFS/spermidine synthase [Alphaproteobacteria bacterium]